MTFSNRIVSLCAAIALLGSALVPVFALADSPSCGWWNGMWHTSCGTGNGSVLVYVRVLNQGSYQQYVPSDFTVSVSGNNPSPSSFLGSLSGTLVTLGAGSYNVALNNTQGLTPEYSTGCTYSVASGESQSCVITLSGYAGYYPYPTPYTGPYTTNTLTCSPSSQTVYANQPATFTAQGGIGTYNWTTPDRTYPNAGSRLSVILQNTGTQTVIVSSDGQTATCQVSVLAGYAPYNPNTAPIIYTTTPASGITLTNTYIPTGLPNTGFEPIDAAQLAFAFVLLLGAGFVALPYVRKALAAVN